MKTYKEILEAVDRIARADYKVTPSGRKSHKEITFHAGEGDDDAEKKEVKEDISEGADYKVTVSHLKADKTISKHDYDVKNANDTRHAKNIAINRHTNKHGLKQGEQIYTDSQNVKPMKEEVVAEAFPYDVDHMPGKLGSRPISGQLGDGGKKDTYVKTFHAKKEKEAHEFAKSKGYVVKKHMYPAGHNNPRPHEFQVHKEEFEQISEGAYERAEENKRSADAAKKQGNMFDHHLHMADHHGDMSEWHSSKGRHGEADKHAAKADEHQELAMKHKMKKEETELDEQAPVAPGLMKHRISVTVSEPDHPMVSKRKEKIQKTVIVTHSDNKEGARRVGEKFYAKKGYRVHDSHHAGFKEEVELDEAAKGHTIEAHGIKGMKRTPWRKTFKHTDHLNDWAEKNDADVHGTRDLEQSKNGNLKEESLEERNKENAMKRKVMDASRGARWKVQNKMSGDAVRDWDGKHKTPQAQNKAIGRALRNEENDTTEKNEMAQTQLHFVQYAAEEIMDYIEQGGVIEEWYQNKLSKVHSDMESLHSYMEGEARRTGMKEEAELDEAETYRARAQGRFTTPKYKGQTHDKDPHGGGSMAKSRTVSDIAAAAERRAGSVMKPKTKPVSSTQKSMSDIRAGAEKRKMKEEIELYELSVNTMLNYADKAKKDRDNLNAKWDQGKASEKEKNKVISREDGESRAYNKVKQKTGKYPDQIGKLGRLKHKLTKEDFELEEVESNTLSYKDFVASLLEYETKGGVYRHKGSYGSSYQGDDDDEPKKKPAEPAEKRGRGRPAGSKSGANQKVGSGKSYGGIAYHSLKL